MSQNSVVEVMAVDAVEMNIDTYADVVLCLAPMRATSWRISLRLGGWVGRG
jgi:hypothetical protein